MQLSARILTALAVLAFAVAIIAGNQNATDEVSAATGTIDALNVGACTTTNADVFDIDKGHCSQRNAFYQGDELEDLIEVETLYATYAHDPKTAAEAPRAIIQDGDLIRVSITDKGRDRRDPVLITSAQFNADATDQDPFVQTTGTGTDAQNKTLKMTIAAPSAGYRGVAANNDPVDPNKVVAKEVHGDDEPADVMKLPDLEQEVEFDGVHG